MLILPTKLLKLLLAFLAGFQVKNIINRWSVNTVPLLTHQRENKISTTVFQLIPNFLQPCFSGTYKTSPEDYGSFLSYATNGSSYLPKDTMYPVALYQPSTYAGHHYVASVFLAMLPAAFLFFTLWYKQRRRVKIHQSDSTTAEYFMGQEEAANKEDTTYFNTTNEGQILNQGDSTSSRSATSIYLQQTELIVTDTQVPSSHRSVTKLCSKTSPASMNVSVLSSSFVSDPILSPSYGRVISLRNPISASCCEVPSRFSKSSTCALITSFNGPKSSSGGPAPTSSVCVADHHSSRPSSPCARSLSLVDATGPAIDSSSFGQSYTEGDFIRYGSMNLEVLDILGRGGQAVLYMVHDGTSVYAVKLSHSASTTKDLQNEYEILSRLSHPNIVSVFQEIPRGFLLDCLFEDLFSLIERSDPLPPDDRDFISLGIVQAVSYLHSSGFAHLDIKPDNILLTASGFPKLADFGLALRVLSDNGSIRYLYGFYGSFQYAPPEMFRVTSPIDMFRSDSWSMGVTFFAMLCGNLPFACSSEEELLHNQLNGHYCFPPSLEDKIHNDPAYFHFMNMIRGLCYIDPSLRLSPAEALSFYWSQELEMKLGGARDCLV